MAHSPRFIEAANHHLQAYAHQIVAKAIATGELLRPKSCSRCGSTPQKGPHAHHVDYAKPLDVEWLCRSCHRRSHYRCTPGRMVSLKISGRIWASLKHESIDRHTAIGALVSIAFERFMQLPEDARDRIAREAR